MWPIKLICIVPPVLLHHHFDACSFVYDDARHFGLPMIPYYVTHSYFSLPFVCVCLSLFYSVCLPSKLATEITTNEIGKIERITRMRWKNSNARKKQQQQKAVTIVQTNLCVVCTLCTNNFFLFVSFFYHTLFVGIISTICLSLWGFFCLPNVWVSIKPQKANSWMRVKFFGLTGTKKNKLCYYDDFTMWHWGIHWIPLEHLLYGFLFSLFRFSSFFSV